MISWIIQNIFLVSWTSHGMQTSHHTVWLIGGSMGRKAIFTIEWHGITNVRFGMSNFKYKKYEFATRNIA